MEWHPTLKGIVCFWNSGKIIIGEFAGLEGSPTFRVLGDLNRVTRYL